MKNERTQKTEPLHWKGDSGVLPTPDSWDGRCLEGPAGRLAIVLGPASLEHLRSGAQPTHWLLPLDNPSLVKQSATLPGEVLWISLRHPTEVLGKLNDSYRGAWVHGNALTIRLDGDEALQGWTRVSDEAWSLERVAEAVAMRWTGGVIPLTTEWPVMESKNNNNLARVAA